MTGLDPATLGIDLPEALFIDTNVFVLLAVGLTDRSAVNRVRATRDRFESEDFDLLIAAVGKFADLRVTPNVLTEVGNLIESRLREPLRSQVLETCKSLVADLDERYIPSSRAVHVVPYLRLGLADSATVEAARERCLVLTDDLDLYLALSEERIPVVNFNHLRAA